MKTVLAWAAKLVCLLIALPCSINAANVVHAADPPNIVLILSDDQAWNDYGFMGHDAIKTPSLDKLARESVVFKRGYVPTALCRPSLMTIATGLYAHTHGVTGNEPSGGTYDKKDAKAFAAPQAKLISYIDKIDTLPELLTEQGYLSFQSGKWWEGSYQRGGFTHGMTRGFPQAGGRHGDDGLTIGRKGMAEVNDFIDKAVAEDKPFFLWYAPLLPHTPHNPPERLLKKYREGHPPSVAKYYAMCEWFDETCGQLIDKLESAKVRDNTLIIYLTDNGWIQNPANRKFAARSKRSPYEGGVRTPILFSWPDKLTSADRSELVSSIDLLPTIVAAAKGRQPEGLPGLNLLGNLTSGDVIEREEIFGESYAHDIADVENPEASLLFRWCIENNWKLLLTYDGVDHRPGPESADVENRPQLFDLSVDPWEKNNLAAQHPEVVASLVGKINRWYPVEEREAIEAFK